MAIAMIGARAAKVGQAWPVHAAWHMEENRANPAADHVEKLLDDALAQTFPASDPVAVDVPRRPVPPRPFDNCHKKRGRFT
jgi:hypothetical protein